MSANEFRLLYVPQREECEALLDTITDALGWVEVGRGRREYAAAVKAVATLRAVLDLDAVSVPAGTGGEE